MSGLLADHCRGIGTRDGTRALTCWKQAVFALALVPGPAGHPPSRRRFGISQATAYRYEDEAIEVLAAKAPTLRQARCCAPCATKGERGFALMSQWWPALQRVTVSPGTIGDIAQSVLVLVQSERKMISLKSLRDLTA